MTLFQCSLGRSHKTGLTVLVRKDMDVNDDVRLSNITPKTQNQVKKQDFYCCFAVHSQSKVFKNELNPIPKMCIKWTLIN